MMGFSLAPRATVVTATPMNAITMPNVFFIRSSNLTGWQKDGGMVALRFGE
jgi:hypothetical protein